MKPLTIDELKALKVGDWVWVVDLYNGRSRYYQFCGIGDYDVRFDDYQVLRNKEYYGTDWVAYKNKEQAEGTMIPLETAVQIFTNIEGDDLPCAFSIFDNYVLKAEPQWCKNHISNCNDNECCWRKLFEEVERRLAELKGEPQE